MAESLLLPVVHGVAGKAANALVQSVTRMCGVDGDRRKLERQLLAVQCLLADAEVKSETNPAVKRWMKDLKAVAYEADDVLDDFHYEALRREAEIGDSTTRKVLGYFTPHSPLLFRVTMSKKLNEVLKKINELVMEMNTFGLVMERAASRQVQLPYRQTHSALDESADMLGREDDKGVVVKLLLDQRNEHKLQVLPIVGMGGVGKTTLAKIVYNYCRVQNHFELKMWHCVSENFEAVPLLKSIIELATNRTCKLPDTVELLRRKLDKAIGRKRFLLILDDVWNEEEKKWEDDLKPLMSSVGGHGSVIVVTTRSQRVASIMGTLGSHELACLNDDDSWELFSRKAFGRDVKERADLVTIGKLIVKKCRGLPLALKTMGGLMSSKQLVSDWEAIAESNIGVRVHGKNDVLDILKLSYRHLSSEMKQCFAFCAVFPKDYEMEKDKLIQLWMANGFIQEEGTVDLGQKGEYIFHILVWRSFLQDVKPKKNGRDMLTYESIGCKMHDLIHDLAKDVADDCLTSDQLIQHKGSIRNVRHMHISSMLDMRQINMIRQLKQTPSLRTLITPSLLHNDLKELRLLSLRALGTSIAYYHDAIDSQVINAKHLRHLDLSNSDIVMLPSSICVMYNLQTLRLNGCTHLKNLPEGMRKMRRLIHLYLLGCCSLERMPSNISLLNNLHTLTTFVLDAEAGRGIDELKDLRHIANRLELYNLSKINSMTNAKAANLHQKQNLTELLLHWGRHEFYMPENTDCNEEEVLESLTPHGKIKVLELHGYSGIKIPKWMKEPHMLQCLTTLHISNCPGCKDLSTVWLSVSLERLFLSGMDNLTTLCKNVGVEAEGYNIPMQIFPKLKFMTLFRLSNLEKWAENSACEANSLVTFLKLEILEINNCQKLASVPNCPVLEKLRIDECCSLAMSSLTYLTTLSNLTYNSVERARRPEHTSSMSMPLGSWPSLVNLHVKSSSQMSLHVSSWVGTNQGPLEQLKSLRLTGLNCFTASKMHLGLWKCFAFVENLHIAQCKKLVCWPTEELTGLIHLRSLTIENCRKFEGKGSSSEEIMALSHLEKLHIIRCHDLQEIPKLPASLEDLLLECPKLVALPLNIGDLARLKNLYLSYCFGLKELPDGMDGLSALECLKISCCQKIERFPQGLLQRLQTLKFLSIQDYPDLQRRFTEDDEYFDLVSSIPHKEILAPK